MEERNRPTLQKAIQQLPEYTPGAGLWDAIEGELNFHAQLQTAIEDLPAYDPADRVWAQIEQELPGTEAKVVRMPWRRIAIAAGIVGLGLTFFTRFINQDSPATVSLAYSTEEQINVEHAIDWEQDEKDFLLIEQMVDANPFLIQDKELSSWRAELSDLRTAKEELEVLMHKYGNDHKIIKQISQIQIKRSEIIRKMAALI